jgi:hypothetical protein
VVLSASDGRGECGTLVQFTLPATRLVAGATGAD